MTAVGVYTRNPLAAWTEFEDKTFVISAEDSTLHELNATGAFIWQQAGLKLSKAEMAERVAKEFEVSAEEATADVEEFLAELVSKGLLRKEIAE